jgi:hypothetical protein
MSTTLIGPAPPMTPGSNVRRTTPVRKFLIRPELGSLVGAIAVFILFLAGTPPVR